MPDVRSALRLAAPPLLCGLALTPASAVAARAGSAGPVALAAASCAIPGNGEHLGPTYLTALQVSGTGCPTGLAVVRAYHACQLRQGGPKATCRTSVAGFRCTEKRGPAISTEFYSSVACTAGAKRVSYKYAQFT